MKTHPLSSQAVCWDIAAQVCSTPDARVHQACIALLHQQPSVNSAIVEPLWQILCHYAHTISPDVPAVAAVLTGPPGVQQWFLQSLVRTIHTNPSLGRRLVLIGVVTSRRHRISPSVSKVVRDIVALALRYHSTGIQTETVAAIQSWLSVPDGDVQAEARLLLTDLAVNPSLSLHSRLVALRALGTHAEDLIRSHPTLWDDVVQAASYTSRRSLHRDALETMAAICPAIHAHTAFWTITKAWEAAEQAGDDDLLMVSIRACTTLVLRTADTDMAAQWSAKICSTIAHFNPKQIGQIGTMLRQLRKGICHRTIAPIVVNTIVANMPQVMGACRRYRGGYRALFAGPWHPTVADRLIACAESIVSSSYGNGDAIDLASAILQYGWGYGHDDRIIAVVTNNAHKFHIEVLSRILIPSLHRDGAGDRVQFLIQAGDRRRQELLWWWRRFLERAYTAGDNARQLVMAWWMGQPANMVPKAVMTKIWDTDPSYALQAVQRMVNRARIGEAMDVIEAGLEQPHHSRLVYIRQLVNILDTIKTKILSRSPNDARITQWVRCVMRLACLEDTSTAASLLEEMADRVYAADTECLVTPLHEYVSGISVMDNTVHTAGSAVRYRIAVHLCRRLCADRQPNPHRIAAVAPLVAQSWDGGDPTLLFSLVQTLYERLAEKMESHHHITAMESLLDACTGAWGRGLDDALLSTITEAISKGAISKPYPRLVHSAVRVLLAGVQRIDLTTVAHLLEAYPVQVMGVVNEALRAR